MHIEFDLMDVWHLNLRVKLNNWCNLSIILKLSRFSSFMHAKPEKKIKLFIGICNLLKNTRKISIKFIL